MIWFEPLTFDVLILSWNQLGCHSLTDGCKLIRTSLDGRTLERTWKF